MIDIGVNLTSGQFRHDVDAVVEAAQLAGVTGMIVTGTSVVQSQQALALAQQYPQLLYATAGIHPHDASAMTEQGMTDLVQLLSNDKVVAVGECGLDFNRNFSTPAQQLSCFERQLELAVEMQLPVFLHQRDALDKFLQLIKKYRSGLVAAVAHCFTGGQAELEACLEADLAIGITGWLCDERRGKALQDCVHLIPDKCIMIETDAPYLLPRDLQLPPEKKAGKKGRSRNEPQYLPHILQTLARLVSKEVAQLEQLTSDNARTFFRL